MALKPIIHREERDASSCECPLAGGTEGPAGHSGGRDGPGLAVGTTGQGRHRALKHQDAAARASEQGPSRPRAGHQKRPRGAALQGAQEEGPAALVPGGVGGAEAGEAGRHSLPSKAQRHHRILNHN